MKLRLKISTTLCLLAILIPVYTQSRHKESLQDLKGQIIEEKTLEFIPLVHIYNERTRKTSVSDTAGNFAIKVNDGDTLVFSAIGFYFKVVYVTDSLLKETVFIELIPRRYEISEARVYALGSYEQFKQKVLALKLPETRAGKLRKYLHDLSRKEGKEIKYQQEMDKLAEGRAVLMSVPILTPEEIAMIKLKKIIEKEKIQNIIYEKYNRKIVADVTGLKGEELTEFMVFCNFSEEYLFETNQYDIMVRVLEKLEIYKKLKDSGFNFISQKYRYS
ncbi:MAG: carboxypeptidase-like regulatory domain-containing protein [Bacteroidales bacterium]|nr:MAG: carboxypeptidase-like regulatory domain-containing protein [Bacteroidales bacterium]